MSTELNDRYSQLQHFYLRMLDSVTARQSQLTQSYLQGRYIQFITLAGKFAGRRGSWNLEKGILQRIVNAGYGSLVQSFKPLESSDFISVLEKGESLMKEKPTFKGNSRRLHRATLRVQNLCLFKDAKFNPLSPEEAWARQNPSSSSGFNLFARKGTVKEQTLHQLSSLFSGISQFWEFPMTRGFRLQLRESKGNLDRKIRLIYPYPGVITLLEAMFAGPFIDHFCSVETFYATGRTGAGISTMLKNKFSAAKNGLCSSDVSSFDQNMLNEVIISSFWILRTQLKLNKGESQLFDNTVSYFCTSLMVSKSKGNSAYGFIKNHGIPSGSGFTNLIGTLAHAIVLEYLEEGIVSRSLICGDDNIFSIEDTNTRKLFLGYEKVFNLPISREKTDFFKNSEEFYFLGFTWKNFVRYISPHLAINQCIWHSDFLTDLAPFEREVSRCASILLNGFNGAVIFKKLFPDVMLLLNDGKDIRFNYLQGYLPPNTSVNNDLIFSKDPNINQSLKHHLKLGFAIR